MFVTEHVLEQITMKPRIEAVVHTCTSHLLTRSYVWSAWNALRGALEAGGPLDCRVLIPPETWNGLTRNPPSLGFETQTSCIWESILQPTEISVPLFLRYFCLDCYTC